MVMQTGREDNKNGLLNKYNKKPIYGKLLLIQISHRSWLINIKQKTLQNQKFTGF